MLLYGDSLALPFFNCSLQTATQPTVEGYPHCAEKFGFIARKSFRNIGLFFRPTLLKPNAGAASGHAAKFRNCAEKFGEIRTSFFRMVVFPPGAVPCVPGCVPGPRTALIGGNRAVNHGLVTSRPHGTPTTSGGRFTLKNSR